MKHLFAASEVLLIFFRLGLTSFGGPIAHLGYFHNEFVKNKKWMSDHAYSDLVALCQFLPGPASSQVGMAIGLSRAGVLGAICAWIGFTLPSAVLLTLFALGLSHFSVNLDSGWLHALKIVAVSVVAQALFSMWKKLCPDKERMVLAILSACLVTVNSSALFQICILLSSGFIWSVFFKKSSTLAHEPFQTSLSKKTASFFLSSFFIFLVLLPILREVFSSQVLGLFDSFYRVGALVFGGGHVVLPLLQAEVVQNGWVTKELFMAGYGMAQAIPGPLFTFSAYLGAVSQVEPNQIWGALVCLIAAFLPSFLIIVGVLPFWEQLRNYQKIREAILGVNAAVVGILLAAFYNPVWTSAVFSLKDFGLAAVGFYLLEIRKWPSWSIVIGMIGVSFLF